MNRRSASRDAATAPGGLAIGTKLGKYEILERLGSGGQSIVYKALDPLLERHVAIKQVAPQLAAEESFVQRFGEVVRQLAKLGCEQIVTIHDLIEGPAGLFVVMEFVEGHTIERTLAENPGPVDPKAVLQIIWRIAAGLAAIHRVGIIHRDVKPSNIIVGEGLRVKITDFGVAARAGAAASMRLGTTKYMAPELFAGEKVDARADVYSLGMIAYEMLLGRAKFNEIFHQIVRDPHSEALRWMKWHSSPEQLAPVLSEVNPDVPLALSLIVERMMAKDPAERLESMEALGKEIRANFSTRGQRVAAVPEGDSRAAGEWVVGAAEGPAPPEEPIQAGEPQTAAIPKEPMSLRKKLILAGTAAGVVMVALIVMLVLNYSRKQQYLEQADTLFRKADLLYDDAAKARTAAEKRQKFSDAAEQFRDLVEAYQKKAELVSDKARVMFYLSQAQLDVLAGDVRRTSNNLRRARNLNTDFQRTRSELYHWTQDIDEQLDQFESYWIDQRAHADAMATVDKLVSEGNLDEAMTVLDEKARRASLLDEQVLGVQAKRKEIHEKQKQKEYWSHVYKGDDLAKKNNVREATAEYDKALAVLNDAKGTLDEKIFEDLRKTAETKKIKLETETAFAAKIAEARKLARTNKPSGAKAYREALAILKAAQAKLPADQHKAFYDKLTPGIDELAGIADDLEHDYHLQMGLQHLQAGRTRDAEVELKKAQSFKDSPQARQALDRLQRENDYRQLVWQGDRLFKQKNYQGALDKYTSAAKAKSDPALKGKLSECKYFLALAEAEGFRGQKQWQKARQAYQQALKVKPDRAAEVNARLAQLDDEQAYSELLALAEAARAKQDWTEALAKLNAAKEKLDTPEVNRRIDDVRYEKHIALGMRAMEERDYASAVAYFKLAKGLRSAGDTSEVDELIKKAEELRAQAGLQ